MGKTIILAVIALLVIGFFVMVPVGLWVSAIASGVRIGIFNLIGMKLRRVKPAYIVFPLIKATKAGLKLKVNQLEAHYLAGGNVDSVVNAMIAAELGISESTVCAAKNVLQHEYENIYKKKVSQKWGDSFRSVGQELAANAWWTKI